MEEDPGSTDTPGLGGCSPKWVFVKTIVVVMGILGQEGRDLLCRYAVKVISIQECIVKKSHTGVEWRVLTEWLCRKASSRCS